ncbi:MAG: phosphatase, partial [Pseudonocardiaceae bacterium]
AKVVPSGLTLLPGAEISCSWLTADGRPLSIHMLAYLFNPTEPKLADAMARVRSSRTYRGKRIVEGLRAAGHEITWFQVCGYAGGAPVGRPHVARALVETGSVPDIEAAFTPDLLGGKYRMPIANIDVVAAIRLIRGAGGVPVLAHPSAASRGRVVPDQLIDELAAVGLAGLEADHADHDETARARLRSLAADLGLFVTGSSDFHGDNKTIDLGENATTTREVYEQIVADGVGSSPISG